MIQKLGRHDYVFCSIFSKLTIFLPNFPKSGGGTCLPGRSATYGPGSFAVLVFGAKLKNDGTSPIESLKRGGVRRGLS